jgi:hypothetical protein
LFILRVHQVCSRGERSRQITVECRKREKQLQSRSRSREHPRLDISLNNFPRKASGSILQFRLVYVAHDISRTVVVAHYKYFLFLNTMRKTFLAHGILTSGLCDNMAIYELI